TVILGALLAPTTGAVGASVLTLGLLALPAMLNAGYEKSFACGVVCSAGTLGTVLPPSIILIVLADLMRGANAEAQVMRGEDGHDVPALDGRIDVHARLPRPERRGERAHAAGDAAGRPDDRGAGGIRGDVLLRLLPRRAGDPAPGRADRDTAAARSRGAADLA